jgi:rod shape-determining protein MreC
MLRLAATRQVVRQRLALAGLVLASVALIALNRAEAPLIERARLAVTDAAAPLLDAVARPVEAAHELAAAASRAADLWGENARLREENARLLQWQAVARGLDAENRGLRELLNVPGERPVAQVTARVIGAAGGSFVRSVLVLAGSGDGVARGQAAVTAEGLAGRVTEVGQRAARVLLLTDMNSNVPVVIERTRERAIAVGDNSERLRLAFLPTEARPQIGDRVVTSGHGGIFPPGLPVGVVVAAGDGGARVQPYADLARLDHVRLLEYGIGGALPQPAPPPAPRRGR